MVLTEVEVGKQKYHLLNDMLAWCDSEINNGVSTIWVWKTPNVDDYDLGTARCWVMSGFGNSTFFFIDEIDAIMFALRWL